MIDFQCPHCGRHLKVPEAYLGSTGNCAHCGGQITIWVAPAPPAQSAPEVKTAKPQQPQKNPAPPAPDTSFDSPALADIATHNGQMADIEGITVARDIEALHFTLEKMIEHYRDKEKTDQWAYSAAIQACHHQIAIAPFVKKHLESAYRRPLPRHLGYEVLAAILEKQELFDKAIKLYRNARIQGWAGNWDARIRRCENELASPLR